MSARFLQPQRDRFREHDLFHVSMAKRESAARGHTFGAPLKNFPPCNTFFVKNIGHLSSPEIDTGRTERRIGVALDLGPREMAGFRWCYQIAPPPTPYAVTDLRPNCGLGHYLAAGVVICPALRAPWQLIRRHDTRLARFAEVVGAHLSLHKWIVRCRKNFWIAEVQFPPKTTDNPPTDGAANPSFLGGIPDNDLLTIIRSKPIGFFNICAAPIESAEIIETLEISTGPLDCLNRDGPFAKKWHLIHSNKKPGPERHGVARSGRKGPGIGAGGLTPPRRIILRWGTPPLY